MRDSPVQRLMEIAVRRRQLVEVVRDRAQPFDTSEVAGKRQGTNALGDEQKRIVRAGA